MSKIGNEFVDMSGGSTAVLSISNRFKNLTVHCTKNRENSDIIPAPIIENLINMLHYDCLGKIFMFLPLSQRLEMEEVCLYWKNASEVAWDDIKKLDYNKLDETSREPVKIIKILSKCSRHLHQLNLHDLPIDNADLINILKNNCQNIKVFALALTNLPSYYNLPKILSKMENLKNFQMKDSLSSYHDSFVQIFSALPENIEEIHLFREKSGDRGLSSNEFFLAHKKFHHLRSLTLQRFYDLNNLDWKNMIIKKNLVHLDLTASKFVPRKLLFLNFVNLKYLSLKDVHGVDGELVSWIVDNFQKLNYLNINACNKLPTSVMRNLSKLREIEFLNIKSLSSMDSITLFCITDKCKNLKTLIMPLYARVSADSLKQLILLQKLEYLELRKNTIFDGTILSLIANNCKYLKYLDIRGCFNVTRSAYFEIGKLKYLETLLFHNAENLPDIMFDYFYNLKNLRCAKCTSITDKAMMTVIKNCQNLRKLNVRGTKITVETLKFAADVTNSRKNNYKLLIIVDKSIFKKFNRARSECLYLSIRDV